MNPSLGTKRVGRRFAGSCRQTLSHTKFPGLVLAAMVFVAIASRGHIACARSNDLPNFVLAMADDQGWGDVGYYGTSPAKTPHLDRMAATGLRLDRFYAAAPVCSPTRGSVMTGRHPNRFACFEWGHSLRPEEVTIAEALKQVGYATGHFGKWHLGSVSATSDVAPGHSGFDEWVSSPNFFDLNPLMSHRGKVVHLKGDSSIVTMKAALQFIKECADRKQPFLAVIWFGSPHSPHRALQKDLAQFPELPKPLQHYYGEILAMDRAMGMLRESLRDWEIADNTLVWYTSDNGPQGPANRGRPGSAGGLRDRKGTLYEGGIRVPTIIEWPDRIRQPRVTTVTGGTVDIYPTLLELAHAKVSGQPQPLDGMSLVPLIDGSMRQRTKPLGFWARIHRGLPTRSTQILEQMEAAAEGKGTFHELNERPVRDARAKEVLREIEQSGWVGHAAWLDPPYKLHRIHDRKTGKTKWELYHLENDPAEQHNLVEDLPDRVAAMRRALQQWQESVVASLRGEDYRP